MEGKLRSRNGCRNCRRRKVKCDEVQPRCGHCVRLGRACDRTRTWKFVDSTRTIEEQYGIIPDNTLAANGLPLRSFIIYNDNLGSSPGLPRLATDPCSETGSSHSDRLSSPSTVHHTFINYLPKHFDGLEECNDQEILDSNVAELYYRFEEEITKSQDRKGMQLLSRPLDRAPPIFPDLMNYGKSARDNVRHLLIFDRVVCRKIMPMAVRFQLNVEDGRNVLLSAAETFLPLQHAICAITLLNSGLKGRPELIAGSFQHYDKAISACRSNPFTSSNTTSAFFLHFVLLMYDIGCTSQRWPHDRSCWALHLQRLASLMHSPATMNVNRLKAYLSWYVLVLDSQAGMAGNEESGHYARSFLEGSLSLPLWPVVSGSSKLFSTTEMEQTFLQTHKLTLHMFTLLAEQSQVSIRMRQGFDLDRDHFENRRRHIEELSDQKRLVWEEHCPPQFKREGEPPFSADEPVITTSTFNFARLQYSVLSLYLHTSMYPQQRLDTKHFEEEDAKHCSTIINLVRRSLDHKDKENHHLAHALFLAAVATRSVHEKKQAAELLEDMENAGLFGAINRVRLLLNRVIAQQILMERSGRSADEVDWVDLSHEMGIKCIVFGI